jgi:Zn-dependent M28 family amino/carboxypeptidase
MRIAWIAVLATLASALAGTAWFLTAMPGESYPGPPPVERGSERESRLRAHVDALAVRIGERSFDFAEGLEQAAQYVEAEMRVAGFVPRPLPFAVLDGEVRNIEVEISGRSRPAEIVIVGAHYDTAPGTPGADDNASGVAVMLELLHRFSAEAPDRTLRFVAFANEEPPYFRTEQMGSLVYARQAAEEAEGIVAMLSLETVGYFSSAPGSQRHPVPAGLFYPDRGSFIAFIGNPASRALLHRSIESFRRVAKLPSEGIAAPSLMPSAGWSDHGSFWIHDYPALMVTDTAPFRNPEYHRRGDVPETLDYAAMAELVDGLEAVVRTLTDIDAYSPEEGGRSSPMHRSKS